ncbi:hypothetical protein JQC92_15310 [Shewanella sp. 202IG2-18]|uniref:hypothetical protein n=1 Tax=Parashewanella hymeniacidonis TaxID=2807618 RepID=UPI001961C5C9|nr:hypothetical protein [Parashewanella hymeniacidonis]MBM7073382.1 hypothetical protein [Parashewanella hymeniacidonis]
MRIGPKTLSEEQIFYRSIRSKRFYSSDEQHIVNLEGQFETLKKRINDDYRLHLNLIIYQITTAIENDITDFYQALAAESDKAGEKQLLDSTKHLLAQFRTLRPDDERRNSYFAQADNYLSWFCEQLFLKVISEHNDSAMLLKMRSKILAFCAQEAEYRAELKYNTKKTIKNPNRISNKMILIRRVLQQGVELKEELKVLGSGLKRITTGTAMALVMLFITVLALQAKDEFSNLTIAFVISMALIYGLREIFKDDVKDVLWRSVQKGRPKWSRKLIDTTNKQVMVNEKIWLEYLRHNEVPDPVKTILNMRHVQNRIESQTLFYRLQSHVTAKDFPEGYQEIKEQIQFSFLPFIQYLHKGKAKLYSQSSGEIDVKPVERRYQVNLIMAEKHHRSQKVYRRFKVTLNREEIISVTEAEIP